ncbi:hypothetical protein NDU88_002609 [Pleurodeles waltl]|uniref:Uncharacterized protein n=1 Tax=Pleurodeles waltl TaxID=8319 RepID=A0AAV7MN60_PLEWA|nr:hypothetical protein NDU88_002609 [Pleurodeles waltl]
MQAESHVPVSGISGSRSSFATAAVRSLPMLRFQARRGSFSARAASSVRASPFMPMHYCVTQVDPHSLTTDAHCLLPQAASVRLHTAIRRHHGPNLVFRWFSAQHAILPPQGATIVAGGQKTETARGASVPQRFMLICCGRHPLA